MSGAFDHNLYIAGPRPFGQLAQGNQLFHLRSVRSVMKRPGAAGVTQAQRNVILFANVQQPIIILVERIFLMVQFHPGKQQRAAAGDNIGQSFVAFDPLGGCPVHAAVDGHKINAVFGVRFHDFEEFIHRDFFQRLIQQSHRIVHRHRANHRRRKINQAPPERLSLAKAA